MPPTDASSTPEPSRALPVRKALAADSQKPSLSPRAAMVRLVATALVLSICIVPVRAKTAGFWLFPTLLDWRHDLPAAIATATYDILFVVGMTAAFALVLLPGPRRFVRPVWVWRIHVAAAAFTFLAGLANIAIVPWLGQPFNVQWLYYGDFLRSPDAVTSVLATISAWSVFSALALVVVFCVLCVTAGRFVERWSERGARLRWASLAIGALVAGYFFFAPRRLTRDQWEYDTVANPIWAFAHSCVLAAHSPKPFSMHTPYGPEDFLPPITEPTNDTGTTTISLLPNKRAVPRNVIFFVLESVSSRYVGLYGATPDVMPELQKQRTHAAIFTNAYAHAPASTCTFVSLLCGIYPRVSFRITTAEHPDIALPLLPNLLKSRGYNCGFFSSGSLGFQRMGDFMHASGSFDRIEDHLNRARLEKIFTPPWDYLSGNDDMSTVTSLIQWIKPRREQPFFATLWTMQTHHPYFVNGVEEKFADDPAFNRYLNALRDGDRALGRLLSWLDETGLAESTVVVVLGDHGESFGQHKARGHGTKVYEENIHIPLVLINPLLFHGETFDTIAGTCDIAPTIAELLRIPPMHGWQGRSLFSTQRTGRVYFFAAWSDFLLGYREGDMKVVYNTTKDTHEIFNLATDPHESVNLADSMPELSRESTLRIAAWVQHIDREYETALEKK